MSDELTPDAAITALTAAVQRQLARLDAHDHDQCPECGTPLEYDEVDIGVGVMRGNPGCPACHWTPEPLRELKDEDTE